MKICLQGKYVAELNYAPDERRYFTITEDCSEADLLVLDHEARRPKAFSGVSIRVGWGDLYKAEIHRSETHSACRMVLNNSLLYDSFCTGILHAQVVFPKYLHFGVESNLVPTESCYLPVTDLPAGAEEHYCHMLLDDIEKLGKHLVHGWDLEMLSRYRPDLYKPKLTPCRGVGYRLCGVIPAPAFLVQDGLCIHA